MNATREGILGWLNTENRSRDWLADQCGVKGAALSNWLRGKNPRPIPAKAVLIIENLMRVDQSRRDASAKAPQNLVLEFSQSDFDNICRASSDQHKLPREWAQDQIQRLASVDVEAISSRIIQKNGKSA